MNSANYKSFTHFFFPDNLKAVAHLNMKLLFFCRNTASFKILFYKVQDFGNYYVNSEGTTETAHLLPLFSEFETRYTTQTYLLSLQDFRSSLGLDKQNVLV